MAKDRILAPVLIEPRRQPRSSKHLCIARVLRTIQKFCQTEVMSNIRVIKILTAAVSIGPVVFVEPKGKPGHQYIETTVVLAKTSSLDHQAKIGRSWAVQYPFIEDFEHYECSSRRMMSQLNLLWYWLPFAHPLEKRRRIPDNVFENLP